MADIHNNRRGWSGSYGADVSYSARETAFSAHGGNPNSTSDGINTANGTSDIKTNWGKGASRSLYNVFANQSTKEMRGRDLLNSRLWKGVPQLTQEQLLTFEAAYTGHTFFFVIDVPRFMTQGIYLDTNMHQHCKNLKAIIERASTSFNDGSSIAAQFDHQEDGFGKRMSHVVAVEQQCDSITLRLHEFAGLPVKNAIEAWLTGIYDINSQHGNYHGNLGISGGWCNANHSMSLLVVQVDPSWTEIQDAAYYYNMVPTEVPFDHWTWEKGTSQIVQDADIQFNCNKIRTPAIMYAAEKFMNNRILSMVETSVFNTRQFVPHDFNGSGVTGDMSSMDNESGIMDNYNYNMKITDTEFKTKAFNNSFYDGQTATYTVDSNSVRYVETGIDDADIIDYKSDDSPILRSTGEAPKS